ncbi:MAG: purine nucleoside permease [Candidatus Ancillula sp.]|jgi:purine nucleoside permease|nr:purine nucleoside permease [Candidatus Ancillula sp.]
MVVHLKLLILAQFEPEFKYYRAEYFLDKNGSLRSDTEVFHLPALTSPLFVRADGIAGTTTGMCKANAALTLAVILSDCRFYTTEKASPYIFSTGCAGGPVERTTLGDVVVSTKVVDFDMGHHLESDDLHLDEYGTPDEPVFKEFPSFNHMAYFELNQELVKRVLNASKRVKLEDNQAAQLVRSEYNDLKIPTVHKGISIQSDNFWHGYGMRKRAEYVINLHLRRVQGSRNEDDVYKTTQCEDASIAQVAVRFGVLDKLFCIRDVVNYDAPPKPTTSHDQLKISAYTTAGQMAPAFDLGHKNNFLVGKVLIEDLLKI